MGYNWAVKHLDVYIYIAFCEDPSKAGEMIHIRDNTQNIDNHEVKLWLGS